MCFTVKPDLNRYKKQLAIPGGVQEAPGELQEAPGELQEPTERRNLYTNICRSETPDSSPLATRMLC